MTSEYGERRDQRGREVRKREIEKFRKRVIPLEMSTHDNNVGSKTVTRK